MCQSPQTSNRNKDRKRFIRLLIHEITHHVIGWLVGVYDYSVGRKSRKEIPMWLEEGVCQLLESEFDAEMKTRCLKYISEEDSWYSQEELFDDLSQCSDKWKAYHQAFRDTLHIYEIEGKQGIFDIIKSYKR